MGPIVYVGGYASPVSLLAAGARACVCVRGSCQSDLIRFDVLQCADPADAIKSTVQGQSFAESPSLFRAARLMYQEAGVGAFFRGFVPCALRAAPVNAVTFLAFELAMRGLNTVM